MWVLTPGATSKVLSRGEECGVGVSQATGRRVLVCLVHSEWKIFLALPKSAGLAYKSNTTGSTTLQRGRGTTSH
jgi:hypothetical protein